MDRVLRNLRVTTRFPDDVPADLPADVERVFVFDEGVAERESDGSSPDAAVEVNWAGEADLGDYDTFATLADDVLYSLKGGRAALVVRRPDAALTTAVLGKRNNISHPQAVDFLREEHDPVPDRPDETLNGHIRQYVNE